MVSGPTTPAKLNYVVDFIDEIQRSMNSYPAPN